MKTFLASLLLLTSISSFAQQLDSVDLIFFRGQNIEDEWTSNAVKVKITRSFYDRMMAEKLSLYCKVTTNKKALLFMSVGQVGVKHENPRPKLCEHAGCFTSELEDLESSISGATLYVYENDDKDNITYIVSSSKYYENKREWWDFKKVKWPNVSDMPYATIFDPKIHESNNIPVTESFYCYVANKKNEIVSPEI